MIGMEIVQFVEGNMLRRAAGSSLELRHRVGFLFAWYIEITIA